MISAAAIEELKSRHPCDQVAGQWVRLRRGGKLGLRGPCPLHSPDPGARDSTSFECNAEGWVCATCADGGDVIRLVALRNGLDPAADFPRVVELLGGAAEPDAAKAKQLAADRAARRDQAVRDENLYRERERQAALDIWQRGEALEGSYAEEYLRGRGIAELPPELPPRYGRSVAYFDGSEENEIGRKAPRAIYRGPALLAPIVAPLLDHPPLAGEGREGAIRAVHVTWIDIARPGHKAEIRNPDTGELLPSKKVRGSKAGNVIRLAGNSGRPHTLLLGEGIETVLSVWYALTLDRRRNSDELSLVNLLFWAAVDLGNVGGRAAASVTHPTLKDAAGRRRKVPGPVPDLAAPGITVPDSVTDVVLLGDGDSDRFTTHCALARGAARLARPGRTVRLAWAPEGMDFNDEIRRGG
jgi:hypothetical protein